MGSFVLGSSEIAAIRVRVTVAGTLRNDLYCVSVERGLGTAGSTATIEAPGLRWDEGKGLLGSEVRVTVDGLPVFAGLLTSRSGAASAGETGVTFGAVSFVGLMDTVHLGQDRADEQIEFSYPRFARRNGVMQATGWTVKSILRDIFGSSTPSWRGGGANLPSGWRSRIDLGSLAAIDGTYNAFPVGDVAFRLTTLQQALEQLLSDLGTVSFRERVTSGATVLDFFELGDRNSPARRVVVARVGEHIEAVGSNVLSISREDSLDGVRSRVIGCGAPRKTMISIATNHGTMPLRKGWSTGLESDVLANPERVKGTARGSAGSYENVFRRYLIPEEIRRLLIDEKQAAVSSNGAEIPIQVWKIGRTPAPGDAGAWTSTLDAVPTFLDGAQVDIRGGVILLKEPAVNLVSAAVSGGEFVDVYEAAVVGVTLTVAGRRIVADTGVDGPEGVASGLTRQIINESFEGSQIGGTVAGATFNSCWYLDEAAGPVNVLGTLTLRDDAALLSAYTALALREANEPRAGYAVTLPFFSEAFRLGDRIEVVGEDGYDYGTHQIRSLAWNLTADHSTTISTDNQVPMIYQTLGGV